MSRRTILVLGGGFGGLESVTRLRERLDESCEVVLIDRSDSFVVGSSNIDVLSGRRTADEVRHPYSRLEQRGVRFVHDTVSGIDPESKRVETTRTSWNYDYLVVALGAELSPEATPGFAGNGHHFYAPDAAAELHRALAAFPSGRIVVSVLGMPYRCPPAPYEGVLAIDRLLRSSGVREAVDITVTFPGPRPLGFSPEASDLIEHTFGERGIRVRPETRITAVEGDAGGGITAASRSDSHGADASAAGGHAVTSDGGLIPLDLFVGVPIHRPPLALRESPLGEGSWIPVDRRTFASQFENVVVIGDCAAVGEDGVTVPKAGVFAEEGARVAVDRIVHSVSGVEPTAWFRGEGSCYFEVDPDRVAAIRADFFGGDRPVVRLDGPSAGLRDEKKRFVTERIARWFGA